MLYVRVHDAYGHWCVFDVGAVENDNDDAVIVDFKIVVGFGYCAYFYRMWFIVDVWLLSFVHDDWFAWC